MINRIAIIILFVNSIIFSQIIGWEFSVTSGSNYITAGTSGGVKFVETTGTAYIEKSGFEIGKIYRLQGNVTSFTSGELNAYNGSTETVLKASAGAFDVNVTMASTTLRLQVDNNTNLVLGSLSITRVYDENYISLPVTETQNQVHELSFDYKEGETDESVKLIYSINNQTDSTNTVTTSYQTESKKFVGGSTDTLKISLSDTAKVKMKNPSIKLRVKQ